MLGEEEVNSEVKQGPSLALKFWAGKSAFHIPLIFSL